MLSIVCRNVRTEHLLNNTHRNHIHWRFNFMKTNVKSLVKVIVALSIAVIMTLALFGCTPYVANDGTLTEGYNPEPSGKVKLQ